MNRSLSAVAGLLDRYQEDTSVAKDNRRPGIHSCMEGNAVSGSPVQYTEITRLYRHGISGGHPDQIQRVGQIRIVIDIASTEFVLDKLDRRRSYVQESHRAPNPDSGRTRRRIAIDGQPACRQDIQEPAPAYKLWRECTEHVRVKTPSECAGRNVGWLCAHERATQGGDRRAGGGVPLGSCAEDLPDSEHLGRWCLSEGRGGCDADDGRMRKENIWKARAGAAGPDHAPRLAAATNGSQRLWSGSDEQTERLGAERRPEPAVKGSGRADKDP
ncbi:hypothetical protein CERSUDRAFT_75228 [Gelatoporia subvermispora B]|uniref:Uncharacterized protein n=1 Tax=Ceriporiopsis subvermispora (strain B) TaxID=914234 RepID=M2PHV8_CERS8|nr:hypothetical protein CERSUDRAFT_75228 [Gelatoporia subvermispora B]